MTQRWNVRQPECVRMALGSWNINPRRRQGQKTSTCWVSCTLLLWGPGGCPCSAPGCHNWPGIAAPQLPPWALWINGAEISPHLNKTWCFFPCYPQNETKLESFLVWDVMQKCDFILSHMFSTEAEVGREWRCFNTSSKAKKFHSLHSQQFEKKKANFLFRLFH